MELGKWLKHAYAISIVVLLHIIASLSLGHHHANATRCVERERDALLAIKRDLVDNHNLLSSWDSGSETQKQDCCRWERVYCDNQTGHVLQLDLGADDPWPNSTHIRRFFSPAFEGTISPQLIQLHDLTYLNLNYNDFNGSQIPAFIGSLTNLRQLDLHSAGFGGQIPSHALGNLTHLTYLDLSDNDFYGSQIPAFIGSLTSLRYLDLSWAGFTGQIPSHALGNLTHLQYLNLGFNNYYLRDYLNTLFVQNLNWLPHLSSLKYLDLSGTNISNAFDWLETVNKLPNLRNLSFSHCDLPPPIISSSFSHKNSSKFLARVDLSHAIAITPSIFKWLCNYNITLVHLGLSGNQLSGLIPEGFRDMNSLEHLDLSFNQLNGSTPYAFTNMSSLAYLDLSFNQLNGSTPYAFTNMSSLAYLALSYNPLEGGIPKSISQLCSLQSLSIEHSSLDGLFSEFVQRWSSTCPQISLRTLYLSYNDLAGSFPNFTNFSSLKELYLYENQLSGMVPESIGQLSSLEELHLSGNRLSGRIPESIGQFSSLEELHLSGNRLSGRIPKSIGNLSSLKVFDLSENILTGIIPQSIGQLSNLHTLNISMNSLNGVFSETHFSNLFSLYELDLSSNSLVFNVISDWVPPFQLSYLNVRNCNVGLEFPPWLRTQKGICYLDISYAGISDVLPSWFSIGNISNIDISHNQIRGTIENFTVEFGGFEVRFGSNQFEGPIPSKLSDASYLDLSDNRFSEITSFLCSPKVKILKFLNLSSNHVSGELPDCWRYLNNLELLDLSNNAFSGKIPPTIGSLLRIETLKLRANKLVGELPSSLKNCTRLKVIDLGNNKLSGSVPQWLGVSFPNLVILMLQSNHFGGRLPSQLCHLTHIQILDFSMNEISGTIPKCLNNLTSLAQEGNPSSTIRHSLYQFDYESPMVAAAPSPFVSGYAEAPMSDTYYEDDATFRWKGTMSSYKSILGLVKSVDLSSNRLTGEIPSEITHLVGLVSLNLSRNYLTGQMPLEIGKLKSLDSLDLHRNQIDGRIPTSLAQIDRLGYLDLSYNNLSGEIPIGTQLQGRDPSFYAGNSQLCGHPLKKICPGGTGQPNVSSNQEDPDKLITQGFYISLGFGFVVGFWGVCGSLIFKRSWRYAYYKFLNASNDWLYVKVALIRWKLKDRCA